MAKNTGTAFVCLKVRGGSPPSKFERSETAQQLTKGYQNPRVSIASSGDCQSSQFGAPAIWYLFWVVLWRPKVIKTDGFKMACSGDSSKHGCKTTLNPQDKLEPNDLT